MKALLRISSVATYLLVGLHTGSAQAENIQATLSGYQENPPVSTVARGEFRGFISRDATPSIGNYRMKACKGP